MEINISIGVRLKEVREELGLSQTEFAAIAQKAGVAGATRQSQANYEKGKQTPSAAYIAAIAAAGADILYILTGQRTQPQPAETEEQPANTVADEQAATYADSPRETALIDNYRHCDEEGQKALEAMARQASELNQMKAAGVKPAKNRRRTS